MVTDDDVHSQGSLAQSGQGVARVVRKGFMEERACELGLKWIKS